MCLLLPTACTLFLCLQKIKIQHEVDELIQSGIDKKDLTLFTFTEKEISQLNWKHSKEFEYKGEMYDIVEREKRGNSTLFWCWKDEKETKHNAKVHGVLRRLFGNKLHQKNQKQKGKFLNLVYYFIQEETTEIELEVDLRNFHYQLFYSAFIPSPIGPPPKYC